MHLHPIQIAVVNQGINNRYHSNMATSRLSVSKKKKKEKEKEESKYLINV